MSSGEFIIRMGPTGGERLRFGPAALVVSAGWPAALALGGALSAAAMALTIALILVLRRAFFRVGVALVAPLPALALDPTPSWTGAAGAALLLLSIADFEGDHRSGRPPTPSIDALQRHIARCRRYGSSAHLLIVRTEHLETATRLLATLRVADSATLLATRRPYEVAVMADAANLDRWGMELRLAHAVPRPLSCGWASFPDDGLSLGELLDRARASLRPLASDSEFERSVA